MNATALGFGPNRLEARGEGFGFARSQACASYLGSLGLGGILGLGAVVFETAGDDSQHAGQVPTSS
jgi:hypothetical protein